MPRRINRNDGRAVKAGLFYVRRHTCADGSFEWYDVLNGLTRLPAHEFHRLMQAAKPVAEPARDAMLKDIAAELGQHEVVGPGLLHRIISEVQRRYDVADQRRTTAQKREDPGWM